MRVSIQQLYQASRQCQHGKAKGAECQRYQARLLDELFDTQTALQSKTWRPAPMQVFVADNGSKPREICAPAYRDRVVHHYFVPQLQALIEPKFIYDCAANMKGKGTHFAVGRLQRMMRSDRGRGASHYLQLDVANFFYNIRHDVLLTLLNDHLRRAVRDKNIADARAHDLAWLCRAVLTTPKLSIRYQHRAKLNRLPPHKRIANCKKGVGLPIGNLSSQFFSNVYLNELDQFVKHQLKCQHYVRYVDDFVLLSNNPLQLVQWRDQIEVFLKTNLALKLKPEQYLRPINLGVDFLGYIVRPHYCLTRRRVLHNWRAKLDQWRLAAGFTTTQHNAATQRPDPAAPPSQWQINSFSTTSSLTKCLDKLEAICASYLGHCQHAKSFNGIQTLLKQQAWLHTLFVINGLQWQPRWKCKKATSFKQQCRFFKQQFAQCDVLLIQQGNCFLRLEQQQSSLLPMRHLRSLTQRLRQQRRSFAWIAERGYVHNRLKNRQLKHLYIQQKSPSVMPLALPQHTVNMADVKTLQAEANLTLACD